MVSDRGTINVTVGNHPPVDAPDPSDAAVPSDRRGARSDDSSDPAAHRFDAPADGTSAAHLPGQTGQDGDTTDTGAAARERQERRSFEKAAQDIREAVRNDPALTDVMKQLAIDMTPEGLRIQLLDDDHQPMFSTGSAALNDRARLLLQKIAPVLMRMPESISIAGHTDATPFAGAGRTNWELSSERANATRRLLTDSGLPEMRVRTVTGNADRDPLLPNDPLAAANRRIAIVVLRAARPVAPASRPQP
jgi:chemotaxis protein MotB